MTVSGKRRCDTGHHITEPHDYRGVKGERCRRCGCFLLTIEANLNLGRRH